MSKHITMTEVYIHDVITIINKQLLQRQIIYSLEARKKKDMEVTLNLKIIKSMRQLTKNKNNLQKKNKDYQGQVNGDQSRAFLYEGSWLNSTGQKWVKPE